MLPLHSFYRGSPSSDAGCVLCHSSIPPILTPAPDSVYQYDHGKIRSDGQAQRQCWVTAKKKLKKKTKTVPNHLELFRINPNH